MEPGSVALLRQVKEKLIDEVVEFEARRPLMTTSAAIKIKTWPDSKLQVPLIQNNARFFEVRESSYQCSDSTGHRVISNF